jgi:hypothetical protein
MVSEEAAVAVAVLVCGRMYMSAVCKVQSI